jgi:hypothetical protein
MTEDEDEYNDDVSSRDTSSVDVDVGCVDAVVGAGAADNCVCVICIGFELFITRIYVVYNY